MAATGRRTFRRDSRKVWPTAKCKYNCTHKYKYKYKYQNKYENKYKYKYKYKSTISSSDNLLVRREL